MYPVPTKDHLTGSKLQQVTRGAIDMHHMSQCDMIKLSWSTISIWMDENFESNGYILYLHSSYTHWVNPEYCSNFNGIILPLATI